MSALTPPMKVLAKRLLEWDRERVDVIQRGRPDEDLSAYRARQDLAEICIDADVKAWPVEIKDLFHGCLEATRTPSSTADQRGIGLILKPRPWPKLNRSERAAYKEFATVIDRIKYMKEVRPKLWGDEDLEGD